MKAKRIIWLAVAFLLTASRFGSALGQTTLELSTSANITINGISDNDNSGIGIAMGDINGDGAQDLVIGARTASPGGRFNAGQTYVLFGPLFPGNRELSTSADIAINGIDSGDWAGFRVAIGDINGDSAQDLILGAPSADPNGKSSAGETYVLFGPLSAGTIELSTSADITINGIDAGDLSGTGVAVGDVNGDGAQDLAIGAEEADPGERTGAGETYVLFGPLSAGTRELSTSANITVNGIDSLDDSGSAVAIGDMNGDTFQDLIIGAWLADPGGRSNAGETYVLFGPLSAGTRELSTSANITVNGIDSFDDSGSAVAVGDSNGDGAQDLIIGAWTADPGGRSNAGETYVLFGPLSAGTRELSISANITVNGIDSSDSSGRGVAMGDVNGDGSQDLLIGALSADPGGRTDAGETYVLLLNPRATLLVPWYNDAGTANLSSYIALFNASSVTITVTVAYTGPAGQDATPAANTFIMGPNSSKAGRPFQASGAGEGIEAGPPETLPNATSAAPFGSATFTAQMPAGGKLVGDTLRMGLVNIIEEAPSSFSGIAPGVAR